MKGISNTSSKKDLAGSTLVNSISEKNHDSDEQTWINASRSDPLAFDHLYNRYISRIYRYVLHRLNNKEEAEEITSQTFLAALEGIKRYEHRGSFISWLITIARNKMNDYFRRQRPQGELSEEIPDSWRSDPLGEMIANEQKRNLADLITALPPEEQELLRLRFVAEMNYSEIAEIVEKTEAAAKKQIYRIILRMQNQVEVNHD